MKITEHADGAAEVVVDDYGDLLSVRSLAEWHMTGPRTVATRSEHLRAAGLSTAPADGIGADPSAFLFDYQRWITELAIDRERFAVFADTGLGKTAIQLDWARIVTESHGGRTLIVAPLQVCAQTRDEAAHFYGAALAVADLTDRARLNEWMESGSGIGITNYEKIDGTDTALPVQAVVLDESSALKQSMGARRSSLIAAFRGVRWKLCCTATPAPNDRVEYAEHAYFLDQVRSTREFLAAFFVNRDGGWQLKGHGRDAFYRHLAAWSVFIRHPAAYGFEDNLRALPPLTVKFPAVDVSTAQMERGREWDRAAQQSMFGATAGGVTSRTKLSQIANGFELTDLGVVWFDADKPQVVADLANETHADEQVIVWVDFDAEAEQLGRLIPDACVLSGKTPRPERDRIIGAFRKGEGPRVLVAKAAMFGFGLNLQSCRIQVWSTLRDSFERYYQAVRRSYRYGQTRPVIVYVPIGPLDRPMIENVLNKQATWEEDAALQEAAYVAVLRPDDTTEKRIYVTLPQAEIDRHESDSFTLVQGDSIAHMPTMDADSMDLAVFSPPFANLFTYSSSLADMGNVRSDTEYRLQWEFFVAELFRVMKPGRVVAAHCMDVIRFAGQHGHRYTYDYPSDLRKGMEDAGFRYHARISIDKNPQIQAVRTKDQNLLFVTLTRDALNSHPQAGEYVLVFRKPGDSPAPVLANDVSNQEWIKWAHHIWYGIGEGDVLNAALAREEEDERHICPLQLSLIERVVRLWSNRDETVFSPFAGIGSEGYEALRWGRRFYGVELRKSYFDTAVRFCAEQEERQATHGTLFA